MSDDIYMSPPELARENIFQTMHHMDHAEKISNAVVAKVKEVKADMGNLYPEASSVVLDSKA